MPPKCEPYGTWKTCITEDYVIKKITNTIDEVLVDPIKSTVYRLESRPKDDGRGVLVRVGDSGSYDVTPKNYNVRTGVHAYGGAAATVLNGTAYFSNFSLDNNPDGRVYKVVDVGPDQAPSAITPKNEKHCFAGLAVHPKDHKFIVAILEDHSKGDDPKNVANVLCVINVDKPAEEPKLIANKDPTQDFYGPPVFSPNGAYIAWQQWKHPYMPWDKAEIYIAEVKIENSSFTLGVAQLVPFDSKGAQVSLAYPNWSNDDTLIFTSDVSGFVNPWKYNVSNKSLTAVFSTEVQKDFGCPMWSLHFFPFAILDETLALFIGTDDGHDNLYRVDLKTRGSPLKLDTECVVIDGLRSLGKGKDGKFKIVFAGTKVDKEAELVYCEVSPNSLDISLRASVTDIVEKDWISLPTRYAIQGYDGLVYVVYYKPKNPDYSGPDNEKPPCIVHVHGGPEWLQPQGLDWTKQYFTSRGWAWVDVNYGGSSGYGRKYRERLANRWGVVDTDDCISTVLELSKRYNLIDPKRVCIRGGSAGGFTTYAALSYGRHQGVFAAGTSIYGGVADLESLTEKAEKFELYYTQKLVGGSVEDIPWIYKERSPLTHAGEIKVPLLILHGLKDPVVPFKQAQDMYKGAGVSADIQLYPGEGHHFGQEKHIKDALWRERAWYERTLKLKDSTAV